MNKSKILIPVFAIFIFGLLFLNSSVYAGEMLNYQESSEQCNEVSTLTQVINITDSTDFDFIEGENYLITTSGKIGGQSGVDTYTMRLLHNATIFEGSELSLEPTQTNNSCSGAGDNFFNYFFFTVWTPNATEATQDIILEVDSPEGSDMQYDDIAVSIFHLDGGLTENVDWFFDEQTTTETIGESWATPNNATLSFTPILNNTDWMFLGTNQIETGSATVNYESRFFFNGTQPISDFPLISREGEDPTTDMYVQTMSRAITLDNSTETLVQMQSQIDSASAGTHERTYSSLFALNLNQTREHTFLWIEPEADLIDDEIDKFGTIIANLTHTVPVTDTDLFILSDFGTKDMSASNDLVARVQLNDVDLFQNMTIGEEEFNNEYDNSDIFRWTANYQTNVANGTHAVNVTGSQTIPSQDGETIYNSLIVFSLVIPESFNNTPLINDTMSWTDDILITLSRNQTDPMSWIDDIDISTVKNVTNPMSWNDAITISLSRNQTDPMSMVDDIRFDFIDNQTNPMSWTDDIEISTVKNVTNPMSWTDFVNATLGKSFDDPMSWTDEIRLDVNVTKTDPMSWLDDINVTTSKVFDDPMSWTDDITFGFSTPEEDPMSWTDKINIFRTFGSPPIPPVVIPPITGGGGGVGGGDAVPTIPDSDLDGILDTEDQCPLEPETFNNFQDLDGCPDVFGEPEPITVFDLGFPFGFNELSVVDDFINLETDSPQPQVEDLGIRWLGDEPVTITKVDVGSSPFEIQFEDLPVSFGNNQFGYTQEQVIYTVQEPNKVCTAVFSFDCVDDVTYEIPVVITGEVRGKVVIAEGSLVVDNSNRFNPYWYALFFMFLIPFFAFFLWRRKKKQKPKKKTLLKVTQAKPTGRVEVTRAKPLKAGTTRKILTESEKTNILGKKTK